MLEEINKTVFGAGFGWHAVNMLSMCPSPCANEEESKTFAS